MRFTLPLPVWVVADLAEAVNQAAERLGYTDICVRADAPDTWSVIGTPPARPVFIERDQIRERSRVTPGEE
jgi:hypothetical protein